MRKNSCVRRLLCLLLALAMVFGLCACGGRPGSDREETDENAENVESVETVKETVSADDADAYMHNDATIVAHKDHNASVDVSPIPERDATEFHLYVPNTNTMLGFVNTKSFTAYQEAIQGIVTAANEFDSRYGHYMTYAAGAPELSWTQTELNDRFTLDAQAVPFYEDNEQPVSGSLSALFRDNTTPFVENGLSVIVSNFVEPRFDVSYLANGVRKYFDSYEKSAACIIGFTSHFKGEFFIPENRSSDKSAFFVHNFTGDVPCYILVVGPLAEVNTYTETLFKTLDSRKVDYYYDSFSNNVYEEVFAQPLKFNMLPDIGERKVNGPVLESYNTGILTERATGNAYFSTTGSATAKDAGRAPTGVSITRSSQIALLSDGYQRGTSYDAEYTLYKLEDGGWVDAGKNDLSNIAFTMEPVSGPVEGETGMILASGSEEMYVSAQLDFSEESTLNRDTVYRLEVCLHLKQPRNNGGNDHSLSKLSRMSTTGSDYYDVVDQLCVAYFGNYVWTGTMPHIRDVAEDYFTKTPNLDSLLLSLSEMEGAYRPDTDKFTYLDFIFNLKNQKSKR